MSSKACLPDNKSRLAPASTKILEKTFSEDSSSERSESDSEQHWDQSAFPPPNPLPTKALMALKEPIRVGANVSLLYDF